MRFKKTLTRLNLDDVVFFIYDIDIHEKNIYW